jgi:predicted nucleic acid-binding protein
MRHLFDTSALLAHFRNEPGGSAVQALFEREEVEPLVSSITIAEFARRMRDLGADEPTIKEVLEFYVSMMDETVAVDASVAWESDRLQRSTSARLPLADALIAACAITNKAVLVHRDAHMRSIPSDQVKQLDLGDSAP